MFNKLISKVSMESWVILGLFAAGWGVRFYHLGLPSFCDDEISTVRRVSHSFFETIYLLGSTAFPPLHYAILNIWVRIFGSNELSLRIPSAIFSSLTVIVIYKIGKELFSKGVGLLASLLLVFSPFAINYAQNAKMYALYWFLTSVAFLFFFYYLKDQGKKNRLAYIIASILCCYTMYTGFLMLVTQGIIFLVLMEKKKWKEFFTGQLIIFCCCLPWVIYFLFSPHEVFCLRLPGASYNYVVFFLRAFQFIVGDSLDRWGALNACLYVFLVSYLIIDAAITAVKNKKGYVSFLPNYYGLLIWLFFPILVYFIIDYVFIHSQLAERYVGFFQIPLILGVSVQINNFRGAIKKILVVLILVLSINNTCIYFKDNLRLPEMDWRKIAVELKQHLGKDDIVVSLVGLPLFEYYYKSDMHHFYRLQENDLSLGVLLKKGILHAGVHSIFILYEQKYAPKIVLNGFILDYTIAHGESGFLHFRRIQPFNNAVQ